MAIDLSRQVLSTLLYRFLFSASRVYLEELTGLVKLTSVKIDLTAEKNVFNMLTRVIGYAESEFDVKNTPSTTPGHFMTTGRPQNLNINRLP